MPIPNAAEWELKCQRAKSRALLTLFHTEPSPTALKFVPAILIPQYGWAHQKAGTKYPDDEKSFRQKINGLNYTDRGFGIRVDYETRRVVIVFNAGKVADKHAEWLKNVQSNPNSGELNPQPYWGFDDLYHIAGTKLRNTFYVQAQVKRQRGQEFFHYNKIFILRNLKIENFVAAIERGNMYIDFDARSGHNHGTKFRLNPKALPDLYGDIEEI